MVPARPAPPRKPPAASRRTLRRLVGTAGIASTFLPAIASAQFRVEEASIDEIHAAIKTGETTCLDIVQAYIERAKAYNGVCTQLVTMDGRPVPPATGYVRAGAPLVFPTETRAVSTILPNLEQYEGLPLDLGRMEPTISDPSVMQQSGMVAGIENAGQINALETLNLRGERSVTCKAACDTHPSKGELPATCPAACEDFRKLPDALERAAELDALYGNNPDPEKLPMYCVTFSVKNWYDVKDMRSTGGNDVAYAMDVPPEDSTVVAALRDKGAIILGVSIAAETSYRAASGPVRPQKNFIGGSGSVRSSWGGEVCNPYDTTRTAGPSSGGAGASVNANLVTCAICETTGGSCREPANQNGVASFVTTKGLVSEHGTPTAQFINHRPGVICRTLGDAVRVVDAIRSPDAGYFDSKDMFTAIPRDFIPDESLSSFVVDPDDLARDPKPLAGMRIGIVREYMVKHTLNDHAISDRVDQEIKRVLRDQLGAEIVESLDPAYPDDPDVPNMAYTFQDAFAEVIALNAPEYFIQKKGDALEFAVPGYDVTTLDYLVDLSLGRAPLSEKLNMRRILEGLDNTDRTAFMMAKYLRARGDAKIVDWPTYVESSKWFSEERRVGALNAARNGVQNILPPEGVDRLKLQTVFRMAVLKVMYENDIDLFVHPSVGVPQWKIGIDREPTVDHRRAAGPSITDLLGVPEVTVLAGYNDVVYDPHYVLSADRKSYYLVTGSVRSKLRHPMPFNINFWAGPGDEEKVVKAASAYEAATRYRIPPPAFVAVKSASPKANGDVH